jgi:hypothetical protein
VEFFEAEKYYFTNPRNFDYLRSQIPELLKEHKFPADVAATVGDEETRKGDSTDLYFVAGVMAQLYILQNRTFPHIRKTIYGVYAAGYALIGIPTAITFGQVLYRAVKNIWS